MKRFSPTAAAAANQAAFIALTKHKTKHIKHTQEQQQQQHPSTTTSQKPSRLNAHPTATQTVSQHAFQMNDMNTLLASQHVMPISHHTTQSNPHHPSAYPHPLSLAAPPLAFGADSFSTSVR
jgi:hypothetical protein